MPNWYTSLLRQADIGQSRTSSLNPIQWAVVIIFAGLVLLLLVGAPVWLIVLVTICLLLMVSLFVASYLYFMLRDPEALRSEVYSISKLRIEKGLVGDDMSGLREWSEVVEKKHGILPESSESTTEEE